MLAFAFAFAFARHRLVNLCSILLLTVKEHFPYQVAIRYTKKNVPSILDFSLTVSPHFFG